MIEGSTPFLERAHKIAVALAAASLLFGLAWAVAADDGDFIATRNANGYSRSAIGFRALGELLERRGIPVTHSRFRSPQRTRAADVLVLAAPELPIGSDDHDRKILGEALDGGHHVLLILPKWRPAPALDDAANAEFVSKVRRLDDDRALQSMKSVDPDAGLVTVAPPGFSLNAFGLTPQATSLRLLRTEGLTPLIAGDDGLLIGELRRGEGRIVVLSDPDVVANGGLAQGENAALALALVEALRGEGGSVVFDETLHGFERTPSIWHELGRAPLKLGSAHLALLAVAALLAGAVRFGRPRAVRGGWREGKQALLDNTAELMELVGHAPSAVGRYLDATLERITEALHAPAALDRAARTAWLSARLTPAHRDELAALTGASAIPEGGGAVAVATTRRIDRAALLERAARIHRFREEVLHGAR